MNIEHMLLKEQDIVVLLQIRLYEKGDQKWNFRRLSKDSLISLGEISNSLKRCSKSGLFMKAFNEVNKIGLYSLLVNSIQFLMPAELGSIINGVPTAFSSPDSREHFAQEEFPYVWPKQKGDTKGISLRPIYSKAALLKDNNDDLYKVLGILDLLRIPNARGRSFATKYFDDLLMPKPLRHAS